LPDPKDLDNPDEWPTYKDPDRQLMLHETPCYASLLGCFLKEVVMHNDFNANSGCINLSTHVDKSLEADLVLTYLNSYEARLVQDRY
jgi:hypothetical protein